MDNTNEKFNDITFFKLWRNIVINNIIFEYAALYKNNRKVEFDDLESLRLYSEREYITEIIYKYYGRPHSNLMLSKGDLPVNGALRIVDLIKCSSRFKSLDCIPYGVEILHLNHSGFINEIQLSELPSSIHTITSLLLKKPHRDNQIPENITSLSFYYRSMDPIDFYDIILPKSIKVLNISNVNLDLPNQSSPSPSSLKSPESFIPSSVTELSICYDEKFRSMVPVIPLSVIKLNLKIGGINCAIDNELIPSNVKDLFIDCLDHVSNIKLSDNSFPNSIKKLGINAVNNKFEISNILSIESIKNSVTDLFLNVYEYPSFKSLSSMLALKTLEIKSKMDDIDEIEDILPSLILELPLSIEHLSIDDKIIDLPKYKPIK